MIVDGIEYTHCRVCHELVQTGGTFNDCTTEDVLCDYLLNHCENDHPKQMDERLNGVLE